MLATPNAQSIELPPAVYIKQGTHPTYMQQFQYILLTKKIFTFIFSPVKNDSFFYIMKYSDKIY